MIANVLENMHKVKQPHNKSTFVFWMCKFAVFCCYSKLSSKGTVFATFICMWTICQIAIWIWVTCQILFIYQKPYLFLNTMLWLAHCTEVHFSSFFFGGFITTIVGIELYSYKNALCSRSRGSINFYGCLHSPQSEPLE